MSAAGRANAQRLAKKAAEEHGVVRLNRADRRQAAKSLVRRKPAKGVKKGTGSQVRDARRNIARELRNVDEALAETRDQIVDPETGKTKDEERRSRLWTPRGLWAPGRRKK